MHVCICGTHDYLNGGGSLCGQHVHKKLIVTYLNFVELSPNQEYEILLENNARNLSAIRHSSGEVCHWGEPERAPHKRYFNARSVYNYILWYDRHPRTASITQY